LIDCLGNASGNALPGTPCNDGNINTINDAWDGSCTCTGTLLTFDCLGVVDGPAVPGTPCDDGVLVTTNDQFDVDCACVGMDCAGVLGGDALPGLPCDDGNAWSYNDLWTFDCSCAGIVGVEEHLLGDAAQRARLERCTHHGAGHQRARVAHRTVRFAAGHSRSAGPLHASPRYVHRPSLLGGSLRDATPLALPLNIRTWSCAQRIPWFIFPFLSMEDFDLTGYGAGPHIRRTIHE
jgi:hypothetical protein